jgi:hypothetical protein
MSNINLLIEVKKEYTELLINILTPVIYDGVKSIYNEAKINRDNTTVLKTFQILLKRIPKWNENIVNKEIERIMNTTKKYPWFVDLIKAVFKAYTLTLTMKNFNEELFKKINLYDFIHNIYIECARELWNNTFLFFDDCKIVPHVEQQRNKLLTYNLINNSINNAIRKTLPMTLILNEYLDQPETSKEMDFELKLKLDEIINIPLLLDKNLEQIEIQQNVPLNQSIAPSIVMNKDPINEIVFSQPQKEINELVIDNNNLNKKILSIIENEDIKLTESNNNNIFTQEKEKDKNNNSSSTLKKIVNESLNNKTQTAVTNKSLTINSNIKNNIQKDLADSDTITYNPEKNNEKYQDVFSNSEIEKKHNGILETKDNETIDTQLQKELQQKENFFNNYLNI